MTRPETWLENYGDALFGYALARLRNRTLAEEAVQDTLLSALAARDRFAGRSSEKTWLFSILKNKITDHFRKFGREISLDAQDSEGDSDYGAEGQWVKPPLEWRSAAPDELAQNAEFNRILDDCLSKVPQKYAGVFAAREYDGSTAGEICKEFGLSPSNLWVVLHRVRHALRKCLDVNWFGRKS